MAEEVLAYEVQWACSAERWTSGRDVELFLSN